MKAIYRKDNMIYLESSVDHDYSSLTDGKEYNVLKTFEYPDGELGYMVCDDDCDITAAKPYRAELFEVVLYACPCCGRNTLESRYNYEVCKTCYWEDDLRCHENNPDEESAPNGDLSLNQYRIKWIEEKKCGVHDRRSYKKASSYSRYNKMELENDEECGCYYCLKIFSPSKIEEWCLESPGGEEVTAICPHCGIDSVIAKSSGYPITVDLLTAMHKFAFS